MIKADLSAHVISIPSSSGVGHYDIEISRGAEGLRLRCSCQAGQFGKLCKHVLQVVYAALDEAATTSVTEGSSQVSRLIQSSGVPGLLRQLEDSEEALESAKRDVVRARRALEHLIVGRGSN